MSRVIFGNFVVAAVASTIYLLTYSSFTTDVLILTFECCCIVSCRLSSLILDVVNDWLSSTKSTCPGTSIYRPICLRPRETTVTLHN